MDRSFYSLGRPLLLRAASFTRLNKFCIRAVWSVGKIKVHSDDASKGRNMFPVTISFRNANPLAMMAKWL